VDAGVGVWIKLRWAFVQSLSSHLTPFPHGSLLRIRPDSAVAAGEGCEYRHVGCMQLTPNLHNVGVPGRSGYWAFWGAAAAGTGTVGDFEVGATMGAASGDIYVGTVDVLSATESWASVSGLPRWPLRYGGPGRPQRKPPLPRPHPPKPLKFICSGGCMDPVNPFPAFIGTPIRFMPGCIAISAIMPSER